MEKASSWHNKAAAQREAAYYRKHHKKVIVRKNPGYQTSYAVWIGARK
jgi:hypothetical protein